MAKQFYNHIHVYSFSNSALYEGIIQPLDNTSNFFPGRYIKEKLG